MSLPENHVTHLVGNPPWLRYSKMTEAMQGMYRRLSVERELSGFGTAVTAQDLSTLFVARFTELYLDDGGRAAFVMPHGTMTRTPQAPFRTGVWNQAASTCNATFAESWDLQDVDTGFPMASCVIRFTRTNTTGKRLPSKTLRWSGQLPRPDIPWTKAQERITTSAGTIVQRDGTDTSTSPYKKRFRNGATLHPRMLTFVTEQAAGPLGVGAGRIQVASRRGAQDKRPWKELPDLTGSVPAEYVREVHMGETILPFRPTAPLHAVLPIDTSGMLSEAEIAAIAGLDTWWDDASSAWEQNQKSALTLLDRYNYSRGLQKQLPLSPLRVVYTKAGSILTAAVLVETSAIIENGLYWASVETAAEGNYLAAILNSAALLERVRPLQTVGLFGPRHFDKHIFDIPIPVYDSRKDLHIRLSMLGQRAAEVAATVDTGKSKFQAARKKVRAGLIEDGVGQEIEDAVLELIPLELVEAIAADVAEDAPA